MVFDIIVGVVWVWLLMEKCRELKPVGSRVDLETVGNEMMIEGMDIRIVKEEERVKIIVDLLN